MKKMKKLLSMLLAVVMVLAMAAPSFAAEGNNGSIEIEKARVGQTYDLYRIFNATVTKVTTKVTTDEGEEKEITTDHAAYTVSPAWTDFFKKAEGETPAGEGLNYVTINNNGNVFWKEGADAKAFAAAALAFAVDDDTKINADETKKVEGTEGTTTTIKFENLSLGYYLVDSTVGTLCELTTTVPDVKIEEKNEAPTLSKDFDKTPEGEETAEAAATKYDVVQIGDTVKYVITIGAKDGAKNYVVHDKMTALTFDSSSLNIVLKETGKEDKTLVENTDYQLVTSGLEDDCTFEIKFLDDLCKELTSKKTIDIKYSATVTADALKADGIKNTAHLTYGTGENPPKTPDTEKTSKTYQFDLQKVDSATKEQIDGAKFQLFSSNAEGAIAIDLVYVAAQGEKEDSDYTPAYYRVAEAGDNNTVTDIEVGYAIIKGLNDSMYYLKETMAPKGYNMLTELKDVMPVESLSNDEVKLSVENTAGTLLPSTGGIGTTIFYAVGIILMAGAVFFVVRRKRA